MSLKPWALRQHKRMFSTLNDGVFFPLSIYSLQQLSAYSLGADVFFSCILYMPIFFHSPRYTQTMNGSCYIHVLSLCVCIHIYKWWNEEKDTIPMVERRFNKDENITYILQESKRSWRMVFGEWVTRDMSSAEVESATREQMWVNLCKLKQQPLQWYSGIPIYYIQSVQLNIKQHRKIQWMKIQATQKIRNHANVTFR